MLEEQAYMVERVSRSHKFQISIDHQERARTPKGPPRRVAMKERTFRDMYGLIPSFIDNTVSKPTLVTRVRSAELSLL